MEKHEFRNMDYWYTVTVQYGLHVADIIVVSTFYHTVETPYIYKRNPAFCFIDELRDYGTKYTPDHDFLNVLNKLRTLYPHLRVSPKKTGKVYDKNLSIG